MLLICRAFRKKLKKFYHWRHVGFNLVEIQKQYNVACLNFRL